MKSLSLEEFKPRFSELLDEVQQGETIEIVHGKQSKPVARLVPIEEPKGKKTNRKLGILEGKADYVIADDFKMTEEEFINLGK
jgi:prevent-host-death family protein